MSMFKRDRQQRQRPAGDGGSGLDFDQAEDLSGNVPDIEDTLDELDRAITEPLEEERSSGCGCWG